MPTSKLPFKLETLAADRHFIPIYPENKQWLIVLKGTELGEKICSLLESSEHDKQIIGLYLDKIYGLYQEERQLLEKQIEEYRQELLNYRKFIATVAKALEVDQEAVTELLDAPYSDGLEQGEKLEPFLPQFQSLAKSLLRLESNLNEDAIAVVMAKRFKCKWTKEETEMLHEGMKKALSDFISNEQKGWEEKVASSKEQVASEEGKIEITESQTGLVSSMT